MKGHSQWGKANENKIKARWNSASSSPPLLSKIRVCKKSLWYKANQIACKNIISQKEISKFEEQLDKLLDLLACTCQPIMTCVDVGCLAAKADPPCHLGAHLDCICPKEQKIPKLELLFIKTQRDKVGERGGMQIASVDYKEDARQKAKEARKGGISMKPMRK